MQIKAFSSLLVNYRRSEWLVCMYNVFLLAVSTIELTSFALLLLQLDMNKNHLLCSCINTVSPPFGVFHLWGYAYPLMLITLLWDTGSSSILVLRLRKNRRAMEWNKLFKAAQSFYKRARIWILALGHTITSAEHKYHVFWEFQKLYITCLEHNTLTLPVVLLTWHVSRVH